MRDAGILKKVYVVEGQHVKKGQVLAEFEDPDLMIRKNQAVALINIKAKEIADLHSRINQPRGAARVGPGGRAHEA